VCHASFQNKRRKSRLYTAIWHDYVWGKQSLKQLTKTYQKSIPYIRMALEKAEVSQRNIKPKKIIVIADVTYFGRGYGILVVRSEKEKTNLYWKEVENEN